MPYPPNVMYIEKNVDVDITDCGSVIQIIKNYFLENLLNYPIYIKISHTFQGLEPTTITWGPIDPGTNTEIFPCYFINNPNQETTLTGNWKLEIFSDPNMNNKIKEEIIQSNINFVDLSSWNNVFFSTFDDGTSQGWVLYGFDILDNYSVYTPGYSVGKLLYNYYGGMYISISKSIQRFQCSKAYLSFHVRQQFTGYLGYLIFNIYIIPQECIYILIPQNFYPEFRICLDVTDAINNCPYEETNVVIVTNFYVEDSDVQINIDNIRLAYK